MTDIQEPATPAAIYSRRYRRRLWAENRPPVKRKRCPGCAATLPAEAFARNRSNASGLASRCRTCTYLDRAAARYGLDVEGLHLLQAQQGGRCGICRSTGGGRRLVVDHDHDTGEVRGLLCHSCNLGLGHLRDSELLLRRAADYLRRHAPDPDTWE